MTLSLNVMQMPETRAIVRKHSEWHKRLGPRAFEVVVTERDEVNIVSEGCVPMPVLFVIIPCNRAIGAVVVVSLSSSSIRDNALRSRQSFMARPILLDPLYTRIPTPAVTPLSFVNR